MAIDTQTKRRAAYNHLLITVLPVPDGTVDRVDREQVTGLYAGIDVSVTVAGPVNAFRTSVELRNQRGKLVKVFNRELATASWSFDRIGGCGSFRLGIKALFDELPVASWGDHDMRVYLGPLDGSTLSLWYRGYVDRVSGKLATDEAVELTGFGYVRQLERVVLNNKSYLNMEVAAIITNILDTYVLPGTDITYDASAIETTGVVAQSIVFNTSVDQAFKTLADLVGAREWGVGSDLKFYFRRRVEYAKIFVFVKKDVEYFDDVRSFDEIKNSFFLQGKDGFTYALEHAESISLYGRRQEIIVNSAITNQTDADQYLDALLADSARPRRQLRCGVVNVAGPYEDDLPLGKISIMGEDLQGSLYGEPKYGEALYGFPYQAQVNGVAYTVRTPGASSSGIRAVLQAAYTPPQIGKSLKQIEQQIEELREV